MKTEQLTAVVAELNLVRSAMERESDVKRVLALKKLPDGKFLYLIETPFETFPKFVIGTCDSGFEDVWPQVKCGAPWTAVRSWKDITDEAISIEVGA